MQALQSMESMWMTKTRLYINQKNCRLIRQQPSLMNHDGSALFKGSWQNQKRWQSACHRCSGQRGQFWHYIWYSWQVLTQKKTRHLLKPEAVYLTTVLSMNSLLDIIRTNQSLRKNILSFTGMRKAKDKISDLRLIAGLFEQHNLRAIIDRLYSLDEISDAFNYVSEGHKRGNVVITI